MNLRFLLLYFPLSRVLGIVGSRQKRTKPACSPQGRQGKRHFFRRNFEFFKFNRLANFASAFGRTESLPARRKAGRSKLCCGYSCEKEILILFINNRFYIELTLNITFNFSFVYRYLYEVQISMRIRSTPNFRI